MKRAPYGFLTWLQSKIEEHQHLEEEHMTLAAYYEDQLDNWHSTKTVDPEVMKEFRPPPILVK